MSLPPAQAVFSLLPKHNSIGSAKGGAGGARDSRKSTRGRSLFGWNDGHRIGLSGRNIQLTDAELEQSTIVMGKKWKVVFNAL
jgi:hypothetical protein